MKKLCICMWSCAALLFALPFVASASTLDSIEAYMDFTQYYDMIRQREAPASVNDAGIERVDGLTGALTYESKDLELKGKGDSNLVLSRRFGSNMLFDKENEYCGLKIWTTYSLSDFRVGYKYVFRYYENGNTSTPPVYVAYDSVEKMLERKNGTNQLTVFSDYTVHRRKNTNEYTSGSIERLLFRPTVQENTIGFAQDSTFYLGDDLDRGTEVVLRRDTSQGYAVLKGESFDNYGYETTHIGTDLYSVAGGWRFDKPSLEETKTWSDSTGSTSDRSGFFTFHDPQTGDTVYFEYYLWSHKDNNRAFCKIEEPYGYENDPTLQRVSQKDCVLYEVTAHWEDKNQPRVITVTRKDGAVFTFHNETIYSVADKYGNTILYDDDQIVDSLGRVIGITKEGIAVNGETVVSYSQQTMNNAIADPNNQMTEDDTIVFKTQYHLPNNQMKTTEFYISRKPTLYLLDSGHATRRTPYE